MLYKKEIEIPSNTPIKTPKEVSIPITAGMITSIGVFIPWGCANLVGVQLYRYTFQITPLTRGEWLKGNDFFHHYVARIEIAQEPWELIVKGYNLDDTYDHTPFVQVGMSRNVQSERLNQLLQQLA